MFLKLLMPIVLILNASAVFADGYSLADIQDMSRGEDLPVVNGVKNSSIFDAKQSAFKNAAYSLGAQNGYLSRIKEIKKQINQSEHSLDAIFDFSMLMKLSSNHEGSLYFLPPVISETHDHLTVSENSTRIHAAGKVFTVIKQGRLTSRAPNWREYLIFDEDILIKQPHNSLLPDTSAEKIMWKKWSSEAWLAGNIQADREMTYRVRSLGQDFGGMIKYLELLSRGMIDAPIISTLYRNARVGEGSMILNEKVYKISGEMQFVDDGYKWKPLISDSRGGYRD